MRVQVFVGDYGRFVSCSFVKEKLCSLQNKEESIQHLSSQSCKEQGLWSHCNGEATLPDIRCAGCLCIKKHVLP